MSTTPIPTSRPRTRRLSTFALAGLVALVAAVARWPWMVLPAAVALAFYVDRLRLPRSCTVLLIVLLGVAMAVALAPRMVHLRQEAASQTFPNVSPNRAVPPTPPGPAGSRAPDLSGAPRAPREPRDKSGGAR